jgi:N-acetylgalactosamine kinase
VKLVAKKEGRANWASMSTMAELAAAKGLGSSHPTEVEVFLNSLPEGELTAAQLEGEEHFGCPLASLFEGTSASITAVLEADPAAKFSPKVRLLHVLQEAGRVLDAKAALLNGEEGTLEKVGELMNASHSSLAGQYECSCPELDELVRIARDAGAKGARLVGAGWGGCIVALVQASNTQSVVTAIKEQYYTAKGRSDLLETGVFIVSPSAGAAVYTNSEECEM